MFKLHVYDFYPLFNFFTFLINQTEPKEEVEHADILELNTIIGTLRQEKEVLEQEKVCLKCEIKKTCRRFIY